MSKYTNNLNLIKPDYDDDIDVAQLNNNMDVIDAQVSNAITVNNDQNRRLANLENKTYPYLPLSGGNMTGAIKADDELLLMSGNNLLTVNKDGKLYHNGEELPFLRTISEWTRGRIICDKYENGKLEITFIDDTATTVSNVAITFPVPFARLDTLYAYYSNMSTAGADGYDIAVATNTTTTGSTYRRGNIYSRTSTTFVGEWK